MQDRYAGGIGDYAKFGLLRALSPREEVGIAWYKNKNESHNVDEILTSYLNNANTWRHLNPTLYDQLSAMVHSEIRSINSLQNISTLRQWIFAEEPLPFMGSSQERLASRRMWFNEAILPRLRECTLVFAAPDNGLCDDARFNSSLPNHWKRIPLYEAKALATNRTAVIHHHNTRGKARHKLEIEYWIDKLGPSTLALYWRRYINMTFFVVNPAPIHIARIEAFVRAWSPYFELFRAGSNHVSPGIVRKSSIRRCPECGHTFKGNGWGGIDVHWNKHHLQIMPYEIAWNIIKRGGKPSDSNTPNHIIK